MTWVQRWLAAFAVVGAVLGGAVITADQQRTILAQSSEAFLD